MSVGEKNPLQVYYYIYWVYVFCGFWKYENKTKWKKYLYVLYQTVIISTYSVNIGLFMLNSYAVRKELPKLTFNMTSTTLVFTTLIKTIFLRIQRPRVEYLLDQLENHFYIKRVQGSEESKHIFFKAANSIKVMAIIYFTVVGIIHPLRVIASTAFYPGSYIIPMPYPERFKKWYAYIYAHQVFIVSHFLVTLTSHDMLIYGIVTRLIAHYEILERNVMKIKKLYPKIDFEQYVPGYKERGEEKNEGDEILIEETNNKENIKDLLDEFGFDKLKQNWEENKESREEITFKILQESISHHQILLKHIKIFNNIYNIPLLVQESGGVVVIGIVALHIIFVSSEFSILLAQEVLYVFAELLNIFGLCTCGSYLMTKSKAVAEALYDTPWYEMNIKNRKTIHLTMKKFMEVPKLRGGGIVVIDRETFLKLVQLSYNMVAVMKNTY